MVFIRFCEGGFEVDRGAAVELAPGWRIVAGRSVGSGAALADGGGGAASTIPAGAEGPSGVDSARIAVPVDTPVG